MAIAGRRMGAATMGLLLCLMGCERRFFHTAGQMQSDGGVLGRWRRNPVSCGRELGRDVAGASGPSVVTLLWPDPARTNKRYANQGQYTAPEVPMRLDLVREGDRVEGRLDLWRRRGVMLSGQVCERLSLATREGELALPEGRRTLAGKLEMDCTVDGSHLTAELEFSGCEY